MKKILDFQKKVGAISKDSENPFYKSKYFDINKLLEVVKPILNELGLVLLQPLTELNGKPALRTIILDTELDKSPYEIVDFTTPLPENPDPQKMGSIITYYRRYSIQSLLGLQAEDDDGNAGAMNYTKIATPAVNKEYIAKLLQNASPIKLETAEDYQEACQDATGLELKEENYQAIINSFK